MRTTYEILQVVGKDGGRILLGRAGSLALAVGAAVEYSDTHPGIEVEVLQVEVLR